MIKSIKTLKKVGIFLTAGLFILSLSASTVQAQAQDQATAPASATIIEGISISANQGLEFGTMLSPGSAAKVSIETDGSGRTSNNSGDIIIQSSNWHPAQFTVDADGNNSWSIDVPGSINLTNSGSNKNLTINNFNAQTTNGNSVINSTVTGDKTIELGGRLNIPANAPAGEYTNNSDLTITVSYE